jgi:hypothetical protein
VAAGCDRWHRAAAMETDPLRAVSKKTRMCRMFGKMPCILPL